MLKETSVGLMKDRVEGVGEVFRAYIMYSIIGIYFEKDGVKLSLFSYNIILDVEILENLPKTY